VKDFGLEKSVHDALCVVAAQLYKHFSWWFRLASFPIVLTYISADVSLHTPTFSLKFPKMISDYLRRASVFSTNSGYCAFEFGHYTCNTHRVV